MSWTWFIYSTRSMKETLALIDDANDVLDAWARARGPEGDEERIGTCGTIEPGGPIPTTTQMRGILSPRGHAADPIVERLRSCRSSIALDRIRGTGLEHPLQVSVVGYLLQRAGPSVVDWGDYQLVLEEQALAYVLQLPNHGPLDEQPPPSDHPSSPLQNPLQQRAIALLDALEQAHADVDRAIDFDRLARSFSDIQSRYIRFLLEEGAVDDASAARHLGISESVLDQQADALLIALHNLIDP